MPWIGSAFAAASRTASRRRLCRSKSARLRTGRGAVAVDPGAGRPGRGRSTPTLSSRAVRSRPEQLGGGPDRVRERRTQQVEGVADTQHVVDSPAHGPATAARCRRPRAPARSPRPACHAEPAISAPVALRRRAVEQEVGDLDRVAPGPHGRVGAGPVEEPASPSQHRASTSVRLRPGPGGERGEPVGEVGRRGGVGRRRAGPAVADRPGRVAADHRPRRDVAGHHGTGAEHGVVADRHAVDDHDLRTDPHVVADRDPLAAGRLAEHRPVRSEAVVEAEQRALRADPHPVAEGDRAPDHRVRD